MTTESHKRAVRPTFRRFFVRGLAVLLPSILTLWLLVYAFQFVEGFIAEPINRSLRIGIANIARIDGPVRRQFEPSQADVDEEVARLRTLRRADPRREAVRTALRQRNVNLWWRERWWTDLIGFAVAIAGVYVVGRLVGGYVGRRLYGRFEVVISSVPVLRYVYTSVKQVVDFLISDERPIQFSRVVAVEYPRRGIWSVGLLTGPVMPEMETAGAKRVPLSLDADPAHGAEPRSEPQPTPDHASRRGSEGGATDEAFTDAAATPTAEAAAGAAKLSDSVTIFIPSSPTPFTGYTITVPRRDVIELPISIDEALRFVVSGGVLRPGAEVQGAVPLPDGGDGKTGWDTGRNA